jgi:FkbH-like protein
MGRDMRLEGVESSVLLLKRKSLRRELLAAPGLHPIRIAVLGGSTTNEVTDLLELLLLSEGFQPTLYQCDYNRYYEEAVLEPEALVAFAPDVVYLHTSCMNVRSAPALTADAADLDAAVAAEVGRFVAIWSSIDARIGCQIIQNNFELPPTSVLGNLDSTSPGGRTRFINAMNLELGRRAGERRRLSIQDVNALSARVGLRRWFDWQRWYAYKILTTPEASLEIARSLLSLVRALQGKSRKCLVLDLDNTLWGGVIGDDGADKIKIGRETPEAEAYTAFQEYCLALRERGVVLAVCSKNDEENARRGLAHPDSVLRMEHFAALRANWSPKHENLQSLADELRLGLDSFVFVDDNPAERALVAAQLPMVAVPDVGSDVAGFAAILESARYFEPVALSAEDLQRGAQYAANTRRAAVESKFADYGAYLDSLRMVAEIGAFRPEYLDRIAQLTAKTNQYNLTARRYTLAEIEALAADPGHVTLYGRLADAFGDNGLISLVVGRKEGTALHLVLWLMSCRVLKRDMELAMLDALAARARAVGVTTLHGQYLRTAKNGMVAAHYEKLGFQLASRDPATESSTWVLSLADHRPKNRHITVKEASHE